MNLFKVQNPFLLLTYNKSKQNELWSAVKAVSEGKLIALNAHIRKGICNLTS
jgi:hypothetical protein